MKILCFTLLLFSILAMADDDDETTERRPVHHRNGIHRTVTDYGETCQEYRNTEGSTIDRRVNCYTPDSWLGPAWQRFDGAEICAKRASEYCHGAWTGGQTTRALCEDKLTLSERYKEVDVQECPAVRTSCRWHLGNDGYVSAYRGAREVQSGKTVLPVGPLDPDENRSAIAYNATGQCNAQFPGIAVVDFGNHCHYSADFYNFPMNLPLAPAAKCRSTHMIYQTKYTTHPQFSTDRGIGLQDALHRLEGYCYEVDEPTGGKLYVRQLPYSERGMCNSPAHHNPYVNDSARTIGKEIVPASSPRTHSGGATRH